MSGAKESRDGQRLQELKLNAEQKQSVGRSQVEKSRKTISHLRQKRRDAAVKSRQEVVGLRRMT